MREQGKPFTALTNSADLETLAQMIDAGAVSPVIETVYPFEQTIDAFRQIDSGHAGGKLVIEMDTSST